MNKRINHTGRKKIYREDVHIILTKKDNDMAAFTADLKFSKYKLPDEARVFVEAYRQTNWMRFDFGTVGDISARDDLTLTQFNSIEGILFRVKVTLLSAPPQGKLLAEGDKIPLRLPEERDEKRRPLLPVLSIELGDELFKVDFSGDEPIMLVNSLAGNKDDLAHSPLFMSLVYPQAFREILTRVLRVEEVYEHEEDEDSDNWCMKWLRFATLLPGVSDNPGKDDVDRFDDWIDEAVAAFARKQKMLACFQEYWKEGS